MDTEKAIRTYQPSDEQERIDQERILAYLKTQPSLWTRENEVAHFTASAWIVNPTFTKTVMVYHHIYDSWSWVGGHADGERDLLKVAIQEAKEETGLKEIKSVQETLFSLEILSVKEHEKKGKTVPAHEHLNVTYLLVAEETALTVNPAENSAVSWMGLDEAVEKSSEPEMKLIYQKLNERLKASSYHGNT